ncbi:hypothetical protein DEO72_LG10g1635 [Vigna unguiculata]|uniref:Uncharacterized protein n=1 Tax=Vigna unguiculata TaxID=3917 RepID=A0A4D6NE03_VIGUN|nr:hypothetical protein DEO72_LG10g1635 [Vigna unguiculata]
MVVMREDLVREQNTCSCGFRCARNPNLHLDGCYGVLVWRGWRMKVDHGAACMLVFFYQMKHGAKIGWSFLEKFNSMPNTQMSVEEENKLELIEQLLNYIMLSRGFDYKAWKVDHEKKQKAKVARPSLAATSPAPKRQKVSVASPARNEKTLSLRHLQSWSSLLPRDRSRKCSLPRKFLASHAEAQLFFSSMLRPLPNVQSLWHLDMLGESVKSDFLHTRCDLEMFRKADVIRLDKDNAALVVGGLVAFAERSVEDGVGEQVEVEARGEVDLAVAKADV